MEMAVPTTSPTTATAAVLSAGQPCLTAKAARRTPKISLPNASITCEIAVGTIFCLPWKYPLTTAATETKNTVGAMVAMARLAPGLPTAVANCFENKQRRSAPASPMVKKTAKDTPYIFLTLRSLPRAIFSEIRMDTATGSPAVAMTKNREYSS